MAEPWPRLTSPERLSGQGAGDHGLGGASRERLLATALGARKANAVAMERPPTVATPEQGR